MQIVNNCPSSLQTSGYDRVHAFLVASICLCGFVVVSLFAVWFNSLPYSPQADGMVVFPVAYDDEESEEEFAIEELLEDEIEQRTFGEMLESIPSVTSELSEIMGGQLGESLVSTTKKRGKPSPYKVDKAHLRWAVHHEADSLDEYRKQLDHFEIEIGVIALSENKIFRVADISGELSIRQTNRAAEQDSLYFAHQNETLRNWDRRIIKDADFSFAYQVVHFFPESATAQMQKVELKYLKDRDRDLEDVLSTKFEIVPVPDGWEFRVSSMKFKGTTEADKE